MADIDSKARYISGAANRVDYESGQPSPHGTCYNAINTIHNKIIVFDNSYCHIYLVILFIIKTSIGLFEFHIIKKNC